MDYRIIPGQASLGSSSSPSRLGRLALLLALGLGGAFTPAKAWSPDAWKNPVTTTRPNILFVIADDLGPENVGAYKSDIALADPPSTPNLDALASAGVRFRNAWGFPVCSPSRAAMYTGRFPLRTGVGTVIETDTDNVLSSNEITLPEVVAAGAYPSALIGKWHLGSTAAIGGNDAPRNAGFGKHSGILSGGITNYVKWQRYVNGTASARMITTYATTSEVDATKTWISTASQPWLATLSLVAPHSPFHKPTTGLYTSDLSDITNPNLNGSTKRRCYKAAVEALDTELGRLLDDLETRGQLANTMVIFVGDNGTPSAVVDSGVDSSKAKGTVYQRGVRVPLIIAGPQVVNGGRVEDALVSGTDLFATIAELTGQSQTSGIDSVTLQPYLGATTHPTARTWVYTETFTGTSPDNGSAALRDSRYKLVENLGSIIGFYNLQSDPEETINLYGSLLNTSQQASYDTLKAQLYALHGH